MMVGKKPTGGVLKWISLDLKKKKKVYDVVCLSI